MARIPRVEVVDYPHHVTQRGNRRLQTFYSDTDYRAYLQLMVEAKENARVAVLAYCCMPNHVHFVVVPSEEGGLVRLMQHPHRRYAWRVNKRMNWQGHLWQSRFYSCPMDEDHLIAAVRYVEMNPVRAGLCENPRDWRWSSIHAHLKGENDVLVDVRPMLERVRDWDSYLTQSTADSMIESIRNNSSSGRPAGGDAFVSMVETATGMRLRKCRPGPAPSKIGN
jgi:putative transposase